MASILPEASVDFNEPNIKIVAKQIKMLSID